MARKETAKQRMDKDLGARLASARKAKGFTQEQMASLFGITKQAYQNYEYGREMKSSMIVKICAVLECSPSWLLGIKESGQYLAPESPLLVALKVAFEELNDKGKRKVVTYAEDLSCNPEMVIDVKSTHVQDNQVSGVA